MGSGLEHKTFERLKELDFSLKMRRLSRDLFAVCSCLMRGYREDRVRLFLEVQSHRIRGSKPKTWKFFLEIRKKNFYCKWGQILEKRLRKFVESPSVETFRP